MLSSFWGARKFSAATANVRFGDNISVILMEGRMVGGVRVLGFFFVCWRTHTNFMRITFYCAILCFSPSLSLALTSSLSLLCWSSSFCCCVFFCLLLFVSLYPWNMTMQISFGNSEISFLFRPLLSLLLWPTIEIQQAKSSIVFLLALPLSIVMFSCLSCLLRSLGGSQEEKKAKRDVLPMASHKTDKMSIEVEDEKVFKPHCVWFYMKMRKKRRETT